MPQAPRNPASRPSKSPRGGSSTGRASSRGKSSAPGRPGSGGYAGAPRGAGKGSAPRSSSPRGGSSRDPRGSRSAGSSSQGARAGDSGSSYAKTTHREDFGDRPRDAVDARPARSGGPRAGGRPGGSRPARAGARSGDARSARTGERSSRPSGPPRAGARPGDARSARTGERSSRPSGPPRAGARPGDARSARTGERSSRPSGPPRAGARPGGRLGRPDGPPRSSDRSGQARGPRSERADSRDFEAKPRTARERGDMPKSWGSVARRGASTINRDTAPLTEPKYSLKPPAPQDEWILEEDEEVVVEESVEQRPKIAITLPGDVSAAIRRAAVAMTAYQREKRVEQMQKAVDAYERNRYEEAARLANRLAQDLPEVTAIREIAGLSSYRSGQWRIARMHLERYRQLSTEPEYLPLEMDAARAMGRVRVVTDLFELLRQESPDPELLAEARLVVAGSIADRGKLREAIELLESNGAGEPRRKPADRHVRQWFALADLFDRAGETPRARRYFEMVDAADPDAYGVRDRLRDLGVGARKRTPRPRQRSIKKV